MKKNINSRSAFYISLFTVVSASIAFILTTLLKTPDLQLSAPTDSQNIALDQQRARIINNDLYQNPVLNNSEGIHTPTSILELEYSVSHLVDDSGHLIPSSTIRHMFDSYLSALDETDLENIISLIQIEINNAFAEPARSDALSLLRRYLDYKIDLIDFEVTMTGDDNSSDLEKIIKSQRNLRDFRARFFSTREYEGFFEESDAHNAFMIEQMRISQDKNLSPDEKAQKLEQALSLLPPSSIESRKRMLSHQQLRTEVTSLRASGGSEEEVFSIRAQTFGTKAAADLKKLDTQRLEWRNKLTAFAQSRQQVLHSSMEDNDKNSAIYSLISEQFDPKDHKRVIAVMNDGQLD